MTETPADILQRASIRPTANRVLVLRALLMATSPMSLVEIETELETVDRSSILRVLSLLVEQDLLHKIEDGRGIEKYEICHGSHSDNAVDDMHPHFYCERCNQVFCLDRLNVPELMLPAGFELRSVNFMLKGVCPACGRQERQS